MNMQIDISPSTWLILLYFAIGLTISMLQDGNIADSGKRILRSWGIMLFWVVYVPVSRYKGN